jgi:hypothetical protein
LLAEDGGGAIGEARADVVEELADGALVERREGLADDMRTAADGKARRVGGAGKLSGGRHRDSLL